MGPLGIIPSCPTNPMWYSTLGWDGHLGFELSVLGPLGIILTIPCGTLNGMNTGDLSYQ